MGQHGNISSVLNEQEHVHPRVRKAVLREFHKNVRAVRAERLLFRELPFKMIVQHVFRRQPEFKILVRHGVHKLPKAYF